MKKDIKGKKTLSLGGSQGFLITTYFEKYY